MYGLYKDESKTGEIVHEVNDILLDMGAFFDMPLGDFARNVLEKNAGYPDHFRRIKGMLDPKGILNPGIINI